MLVSNPYGASGHIGVLSMKRIACVDNHCEMIKRSRCFKCAQNIYGDPDNLDNEGNGEVDVVGRNRKMANCALKVLEAEQGGTRDPATQCTGADASYSLMTAVTM